MQAYNAIQNIIQVPEAPRPVNSRSSAKRQRGNPDGNNPIAIAAATNPLDEVRLRVVAVIWTRKIGGFNLGFLWSNDIFSRTNTSLQLDFTGANSL